MAYSGQIHVMESDKLSCDLCDNKVETLLSKCVDCDVYMCRICTKAHTRVKLTKDHRIIADQHGPTPTEKAKTICSAHPGEDVSFYCYTCNKLICSVCITGNHGNHKCSIIKEASKVMAAELSHTLANFKESNIAGFRSKVNTTQKLKKDNETQGNLTIQNIKARKDELVSEINKIANTLIQECEKSKEENNKYLTQIHTSLTEELTEMESLHSDYSNVLTSGSDIDKIIAKNQAATSLEKFKLHNQEVYVQVPKFIQGDTNISSLQKTFGSIDTGEEKGSDFEFSVKKQPNKDTGGPAVSTNIDVKVISTFNHKSTKVTSICPITDNTALIHCKGEYNNDVVNDNGQVQRTVKVGVIVTDFVMTSDSIMATDKMGKNIYKLTMDGHKTDTISTAPLHPLCLCMSSDGNILVTMINKDSYTVKYDSRRLVARIEANTGQTIERYEYDRGTRLFTVPYCIDENTNGDICVVNRTSDNSGHLVILDNKGRLKVTHKGGPKDKQFDPIRVKCDKLGHIIVSDYSNKKIHLLSSDGQLVQYLMTDKELRHEPYSLSINKQGLLWAGCAKGQVYVIKYMNK